MVLKIKNNQAVVLKEWGEEKLENKVNIKGEYMEDKKVIYGDLGLLFVAIIWGAGFVFTKNALNIITPFYINGLRFLIAAVALTIISFNKIRKISKKEIKSGIIVGFFMFLGFTFQTLGIRYVTTGVSAFITASNVVMVPFMYWVLTKVRPNKFDIMGAILCFLGIGILSFNKNIGVGIGEFLTFLCAIGFGLQIVSVGIFVKDVDPFVLSTIQFYFASILSFIIAFIFEPPMTSVTSDMIVPILYLGLVSSMLGFTIQNIAQRHTPSTHAAIILSLESIFGSIFGILLLGELITKRFVIGSLIILISVIITETRLEFLYNKEEVG